MIKVINPGSFETKETDVGDGELEAIAFRVVHGGRFTEPMLFIDGVKAEIKKFSSAAPLHNPLVLKAAADWLIKEQNVPQMAVFDTDFFKDLPEETKYYPLPIKLQTGLGIRRYGFHGISHEAAMIGAGKVLNEPIEELNLITLHLGQGCSAAAIEKGKPIDTSMGFSPLEGLMMGTRTGDLDPGIILHLIESGESVDNVRELISRQGGWFGVSGKIDFREILKSSDENCKLAFRMFVNRVRKYIGAYVYELGGKVDAIVFTGAIGDGSEVTRAAIVDGLPLPSGCQILHFPSNESALIAEKANKVIKSV